MSCLNQWARRRLLLTRSNWFSTLFYVIFTSFGLLGKISHGYCNFKYCFIFRFKKSLSTNWGYEKWLKEVLLYQVSVKLSLNCDKWIR